MIIIETILILFLQFITIQMYRHEKPLAQKIWSERCLKNSMVLNDCNWCRCNVKQKYECTARVCEEVDMFGHFKDAIQEIDVGMEGHGSWRSRPLACTPGVHYRRGAVLCVCDEDGNWPNPVCRDLFRILHSVELTGQTRISKNDSCFPTKLYLVGCNVCFCPSSGRLDPLMCTKRECQEDDPVIEASQTPLTNIPPKNSNEMEEVMEIYAMCDPKFKYELGCRNCDCLRNNRLLCGNCSIDKDQFSNTLGQRSKSRKPLYNFMHPRYTKYSKLKKSRKPSYSDSICDNKELLKVFKVGCNLCHCGKYKKLYCTVKKCVGKKKKLKSFANLQTSFDMFETGKSQADIQILTEPPDDESCVPGKMFRRDCNICVCGKIVNGIKTFVCSLNTCEWWQRKEKGEHWKIIHGQHKDCVPGTIYEENCMLCMCVMKGNDKYRVCELNEECVKYYRSDSKNSMKLKGIAYEDVKSLSGYCEPMRRYRNDCNVCRCLADGKTVECTSKICSLREDDKSDLEVDIVPVVVEDGEACPSGHSYKLDCNLCFCLSNGNAVCTTADCSKQNKVST